MLLSHFFLNAQIKDVKRALHTADNWKMYLFISLVLGLHYMSIDICLVAS